MTELVLTKTRLVEGVWEGVLSGSAASPSLKAQFQGTELDPPQIGEQSEEGWPVRLELPKTVLADGVHTVVLADANTGAQLAAIHVASGEALDNDLLAEVQLLREELDMLKRAFRRHCVETT